MTTDKTLLEELVGVGTEEQQLKNLVHTCLDAKARSHLFGAHVIEKLSGVVTGATSNFESKVYALKCLSWVTFRASQLSVESFEKLQCKANFPKNYDFNSLVLRLEERQEDAAMICACIAASGYGGHLLENGALPPLLEFLLDNSVESRNWAAEAMAALVLDRDLVGARCSSASEIKDGDMVSCLLALASESPTHLLEAARSMDNLVLSADSFVELSEEVVGVAVNMLGGSLLQKKTASMAIGWLAQVDHVKDEHLLEGAVQPLITILLVGSGEQTPRVALAYEILSREQTIRAIQHRVTVPAIFQLTQTGTAPQKELACLELARIVSNSNSEVWCLLDDRQTIRLMMEHIRGKTTDVKVHIAQAIQNLAGTGSYGNIEPLVDLLWDRQRSVRIAALNAISSLNKDDIAASGDRSMISLLLDMLRDSDTKMGALITLGKLSNATSKPSNRRSDLVEEGAIQAIVGLIAAENESIGAVEALNVLAVLACNKQNRGQMVKEGVAPYVVQFLQAGIESCGLEVAMKLLKRLTSNYSMADEVAVTFVPHLVVILETATPKLKVKAVDLLVRITAKAEAKKAFKARHEVASSQLRDIVNASHTYATDEREQARILLHKL